MLVHILEGFDMSKKFPKNRAPGNFDAKAWSRQFGLVCPEPTRTIQSQKDEADINTIVRNFGVTGKVPVSTRIPTYGDFDGVSDYREAIEAIRAAESSFLAMPADLRKRLDNDPQKFVEWCADSNNLAEMRKLGLAPEVSAAPPPSASEAS